MSSTLIQRRRLGAALALCATPGGWWMALPAQASPTPEHARARVALMGTQVDLVLGPHGLSSAQAQAALQDAVAEMQRLEAMMSRYRDDNPLAALARQAGRAPVAVPAELMAVLQQAQAVARASDGAFDPTIGALGRWDAADPAASWPTEAQRRARLSRVHHQDLQLDPAAGQAWLRRAGMRLDLGGVAKLPILQAGLRRLQAHGLASALVNGGGDVLVVSAPDAPAWRIGLRDAARPEHLLAVLALRQGVVASSGDYERSFVHAGRRYHHVIDPSTGLSSQGVHGVSLVAETVEAVNGLGTAAMVLGPVRGPAWLEARLPQALLVREDASVWASPALAARLTPPAGQARVRGLGTGLRGAIAGDLG